MSAAEHWSRHTVRRAGFGGLGYYYEPCVLVSSFYDIGDRYAVVRVKSPHANPGEYLFEHRIIVPFRDVRSDKDKR